MSVNLRTTRFLTLIVLALAIGLTACSRDKREETRTAEELYELASEALRYRNYGRAVSLYRTLNTQYPFGRHAEQAQLDMAYAYYRAGQPEPAISTIDRFIRTYPTHPNVDYARYLRGLVNYQESRGMLRGAIADIEIDRDHEHARQSFRDFQDLIHRHPDSRYAPDARQRMVHLRNNLAEYEVLVGRFYQRRHAYIAAVNRGEYVLQNYPGAPATVEALKLMADNYEALDLPELAADTRRILELNYSEQLQQEQARRGFFRRLWPF